MQLSVYVGACASADWWRWLALTRGRRTTTQVVLTTGRKFNFPLPLGCLLTGEICIPGMSLTGQSEANVIPYELRLLEWGPDADTLLVAHCAYGDTQLCHLQVRVCAVLWSCVLMRVCVCVYAQLSERATHAEERRILQVYAS